MNSSDVYSIEPEALNRLRDSLDKADCEESLRDFVTYAWRILEPKRPLVPGWHLDAICEHLQAVSEGQIKRLLINVPPGCTKSLTTDVFWPAWEWGPFRRPDLRYVCASYSEALTIRDNRRTRRVLRSDWYQKLWGEGFHIVEDQDTKTKFETNETGWKIATSVGGLGTGERGDRFIIDDPHNVLESESDAKREAALLWFEEVVPTRLNDEDSSIIIIMQRIHERDVAGLVLKKELGYEHLCLPMEFDPEERCTTSIGFEDPRTEWNELLCPERMSKHSVEEDKKAMTDYAVAAQFQQKPAPRGGGMFKREWFDEKFLDELPDNIVESCRGWDLAGSDTLRAAFNSGCKMHRTADNKFIIEDINRVKKDAAEQEGLLTSTAAGDGYGVIISLPQDPGQAGKFQVKYYAKKLVGFIVRYSTESGDKATRAEPFASQCKAGNVYLLRGEWNEPFLRELTTFPASEFKDQVDSCSRTFKELIPDAEDLVPGRPEAIACNG